MKIRESLLKDFGPPVMTLQRGIFLNAAWTGASSALSEGFWTSTLLLGVLSDAETTSHVAGMAGESLSR